MQYHPDRNPGDHTAEHKFKEINEAYEILKDPQKRAAYDRFGHAAFEQGGGGAGAGAGFGFASLRRHLRRDVRRLHAAAAAPPLRPRARLRPPLQSRDHARGGLLPARRVEIDVPTTVTCSPARAPAPSPAPARRPARPATARAASARARASSHRAHLPDLPRPRRGRSPIPAPKCSGAGRVSETRTLSVNIPAGIEDGTRIRLAGEGEAGLRGGPPGDLYIFLSIKPHAFFQRDGADIFCRVPISMTTAALGGAVRGADPRRRHGRA